MSARPLLLLLLLAVPACAPAPAEMPPESDAGAILDPDRDVHVRIADGTVVQVTDLPGAEDSEAVSPDGTHVAFVGGATGIASIWVAAVPAPGLPPATPHQLTNVGLEAQPRTPGQPPPGFVPPPDRGPLRWLDDRTIGWTAGGQAHRVAVPEGAR